jgi:hypothetical protein
MLGIVRTDLNKTGISYRDGFLIDYEPAGVAQPGNEVTWTPDPSHFGNPIPSDGTNENQVDWEVEAAHFGNIINPPSPPPPAVWTRLQNVTPVQGGSPQTITFESNCTPGSIIIVGVGNDPQGNATIEVSDPTNGSYSVLGTSTNGDATAQVFAIENTASTALTITVTSTVDSNHVLVMMSEYSGGTLSVDSTAPITAFTQTSAPSTPSLTTTVANDLLVAVFIYLGIGSISIGSGWTDEGTTNGGDDGLMESQYNVGIGTYTATCNTSDATTSYAGVLVALKV